MSLLSTPARSMVGSPDSTFSPEQAGGLPDQLTPRSKVKAMLAAIDESSDSDHGPAPILDKCERAPLATISGNAPGADQDQGRLIKVNGAEEEEEEHSDESMLAPRGRLAARLNGHKVDRRSSDSSNEENTGEDAYTRIKKQLLVRASKKAETTLGEEGQDEPVDASVSSARNSPIARDVAKGLSTGSPSPRSTPRRSRRASPGLFLTPTSVSKPPAFSDHGADSDGSDSILPGYRKTNSGFSELVARKKAEREAKQAVEKQKISEKIARKGSFEDTLARDASPSAGESDEERKTETKLTQSSARPTRKASKKALEEMSRETQRMSRNMQLAHQAKTKKKITKDSLFARFNFRTPALPTPDITQNPSSSTVPSSAPASDLEDGQHKATPPSSPVEADQERMQKHGLDVERANEYPTEVQGVEEQEEDELPDMIDIMNQPIPKLDKGKGKAIVANEPEVEAQVGKVKTKQPLRVRLPKTSPKPKSNIVESDSDLEVLPSRNTKVSMLESFTRLPADKTQDRRSMQTLRALAHLNSPGKQSRGARNSMTLADMQKSLQKRARQQAMDERKAKIEDLRARGIIVQTAEEREKDQAEVEDLLEKARREADELMQKEKRAARREKIANGETGPLTDTSDEDEDYQEDEDEAEVELSGSDDEGEGLNLEEDDDASDAEEATAEDQDGNDINDTIMRDTNALVDDEAAEDAEDEGDNDDVESSETESHQLQIPRSRRVRTAIVDEDDDEDEVGIQNVDSKKNTLVDHAPTPSVQVPRFPSLFESPKANGLLMGMTQAFAATMADTQGDDDDEGEDSLALLGPPPEPNFPTFEMYDSQQMIQDSQNGVQHEGSIDVLDIVASHGVNLEISQSQIQYDAAGGIESQANATQYSEIPDPTQDAGFALSSPAPETRFVSVPPSTVDTVVLSGVAEEESPVVKKRGRLQRGAAVQPDSEDEEIPNTKEHLENNAATSKSAFSVMRQARKEAAAEKNAFDRKKSEAKGMVEEQAQESEDEYAGLGGASDDESGGEEDEFVREMIDQGEVEVDKGKMAAFYADKERASDEKAVERIFKDINNGGFRRKRGTDIDLSDSEDDVEARRRRKQREFAKMRKALLEDEDVSKIAEDPKKLAFLRAIEDRDDQEDLEFLGLPGEDSVQVEQGTQDDDDSQSQHLPTEPISSKRKRPLQESNPNMRPPPRSRRTPTAKKPSTLAEIRASVSFLVEDPGLMPAPAPSSASEDESDDRQHHLPPNPRRTASNLIIDRLSLKRTSSLSTSTTTSRLAFHDPSTATTGGFKLPSLLRRATTTALGPNAPDANGISTHAATERAAGGGEKGDFIRRGSGKGSSVTFSAREKGSKALVAKVEQRRQEGRRHLAMQRRGLSGLAGMGSFE